LKLGINFVLVHLCIVHCFSAVDWMSEWESSLPLQHSVKIAANFAAPLINSTQETSKMAVEMDVWLLAYVVCTE